jgi:hypothetical protein
MSTTGLHFPFCFATNLKTHQPAGDVGIAISQLSRLSRRTCRSLKEAPSSGLPVTCYALTRIGHVKLPHDPIVVMRLATSMAIVSRSITWFPIIFFLSDPNPASIKVSRITGYKGLGITCEPKDCDTTQFNLLGQTTPVKSLSTGSLQPVTPSLVPPLPGVQHALRVVPFPSPPLHLCAIMLGSCRKDKQGGHQWMGYDGKVRKHECVFLYSMQVINLHQIQVLTPVASLSALSNSDLSLRRFAMREVVQMRCVGDMPVGPN